MVHWRGPVPPAETLEAFLSLQAAGLTEPEGAGMGLAAALP